MKAILRWWFWVLALVLLVGALGFGFLVFTRFGALNTAWTALKRNQGDVKLKAQKDFPNDATLAKANELLDRTKSDLATIANANYDREFRKTGFELFFSETGLVADPSGLDPNRYRSAYERQRDEVLASASKTGALVLPPKDMCGFQYFEKAVELSPGSLPLMQKRFWISKAVYDTLAAYNSQPASLAGFSFVEDKGEVEAQLPALISAVRSVAHKGFFLPLDVPTEHTSYNATRTIMEPFYYFKYWQVDVELEVPAGAVSDILARFLKHQLPFAVRKVDISRLKEVPADRYALPLSKVVLGLSVLDFDQSLFADLIPELRPTLPEGQ